jgi:undecaprenyl-diphosphatase
VNIAQAAVLGIVQGLTEFLPISSTGHLRIVPALFGWDDPGAAFTAVTQLGTMAAILLFFRREIVHITAAWLRGIGDDAVRGTVEYRMGWYVILATIPIAVLGYAFRDSIETGARNLWLIASTLIVGGLIMLWAERVGTRKRTEDEVTTKDAVSVGFAQAAALVPGVSRSGATITAGLFLGLKREDAARFSFLLSVPAIVLSGLFEARKVGDASGPGMAQTIVATVLAFVVGYASIAWLLSYLTRHSIGVFVVYRLLLGGLLLVLLATSVLSAT